MPSVKKNGYHVKIEVGDKQLQKNIQSVLEDYSIDEPFEITEAMKKQPLRYVKWAELLNKAKSHLLGLQRGYDIWYAEAWSDMSNHLAETNGKKPTKDDISNAIIVKNIKYNAWQDKLMKSQKAVNTLEVVVKALVMKKEMLVSVGQLCSRLIDSGNLVVKQRR